MYIHREIENKIKEISKNFKVILVTGARQVGKSTVLKECDKKRGYVTLDDIDARELAKNDPKLFLQRYTPPVIIDEIQYAPELLSYIKILVDNSDEKGQYWLTGSQQFSMMKNVSESLAGRVGILELRGFSLRELEKKNSYRPFLPSSEYIEQNRKIAKPYTLNELYEIIWRGSYPEINVNKSMPRDIYYGSYLQTYLERDIRNLSEISDEMSFVKFIRVAAARTGQMLNYADIAAEVGITQPTAKKWLSILVSSGIVFLLQPYYNNVNKRLVKTPKLYFADTGLCSYLTGWSTPDVLEKGAMSGSIFETFIVNEIIKSYKNNGIEPNIYYYRDKDKKEIDVIIEKDGMLYPIEIKKTASPDKNMVNTFSLILKESSAEGAVICLALDDMPLKENINVIPVGYI